MAESDVAVREIGEFELIDRLAASLPEAVRRSSGIEMGIGDDAAVWTPDPDTQIVITTDALIQGVHFRLDWTDWTSLGHKMLAVNMSDIAAMGARPRVATIVLGLTGNERVSDLESLYAGAGRLAADHGVVIAGGDVVRAPHDLTLSVTLLGDVPIGKAMTRHGARAGDLLVVSGTLGASKAGWRLLETGNEQYATGPLLVAAHLRPNPRVALGAMLGRHGVTAAMDLSDGLLGDLPKILEASGVSAEVEISSIPVLPAVCALFPEDFAEFALRGGEDYELLMTIPGDCLDGFIAEAATIGATITPIGRILPLDPENRLRVVRDGEPVSIEPGAWDHFG